MKRLPLICIISLAMTLRFTADAVPVIYGTDLFHPHDDPDDHFDLATLFALPELEVKAILLDQGDKQLKRPGAIPIQQMAQLTGRRVPFAIGLREKLASPGDDGRGQPAEFQAAVDLLVRTLRESSEPVTIISAGSVRDICAAWNREPTLMSEKVARLYLNIGNADSNGTEYNVDLDPAAYVGLLRSGLPLYLCFCMPMRQEDATSQYSTWWRFHQAEVLDSVPRELQNYFIYALQKCAPAELDPLQALRADLRPWHHLVWDMDRNMWCTASFLHAAGRDVRKVNGRWTAARYPAGDRGSPPPFGFVPADIQVDPTGKTTLKTETAKPNVQLFKVVSPKDYGPAMRDCLRELLHSLLPPPFTQESPPGPRR